MSDRIKIACPECGAPLPPEAATVAATCTQCGHTSAHKAVPQTIERTVVVMAAPSQAQVPCPRCRVSLFPGEAKGVTLLGCGICGGIFLDNEGSTRIVHEHQADVAWLARRAEFRAVARTVDQRPDDLPCPICAAAMKRVAARGVIDVDFCARHGTWFDGGEIARVMPEYRPPADNSRAEAEARLAALREAHNGSPPATETFGSHGVLLGLRDLLGAFVTPSGGNR